MIISYIYNIITNSFIRSYQLYPLKKDQLLTCYIIWTKISPYERPSRSLRAFRTGFFTDRACSGLIWKVATDNLSANFELVQIIKTKDLERFKIKNIHKLSRSKLQ